MPMASPLPWKSVGKAPWELSLLTQQDNEVGHVLGLKSTGDDYVTKQDKPRRPWSIMLQCLERRSSPSARIARLLRSQVPPGHGHGSQIMTTAAFSRPSTSQHLRRLEDPQAISPFLRRSDFDCFPRSRKLRTAALQSCTCMEVACSFRGRTVEHGRHYPH